MKGSSIGLTVGYIAVLTWAGIELLGPGLPGPAPENVMSDDTESVISVKVPTVSIESYDEILERPLFYAGRITPTPEPIGKTGDPKVPTPRPTSSELDDSRLTAVFLGGQHPIALFESRDGTAQSLRTGEEISGWKLEKIEEVQVTLRNGSRRKTLRVYEFGAPPPARRPGRRPPNKARAPAQPRKPAPARAKYFRQQRPAIGRRPAQAADRGDD